MRTFKTIGIVLGIYIAAFVVDVIVVSGSPDYQGGVTVLVILGLLAVLAPKVGYRWFDCFFAAIPFLVSVCRSVCLRLSFASSLPLSEANDFAHLGPQNLPEP